MHPTLRRGALLALASATAGLGLLAPMTGASAAPTAPLVSHQRAEQSAHGARLVISARHDAVLDLRLPRVSLDWSRMRFTGTGTVAVFLEPLDRDGSTGTGALVSSAGFPRQATETYDRPPAVGLAQGDQGKVFGPSDGFRPGFQSEVRAGRYRLHVLTSGPVRITLPARGLGRSLRLQPTQRGRDHLVVRDIATSGLPGGPTSGSLSVPLPATRTSLRRSVVTVATHTSTTSTSTSYDGCLVPSSAGPDADCGSASNADYGSSSQTSTYYSDDGVLPAGSEDVYSLVNFYDRPTSVAQRVFGSVQTTDELDAAQVIGLSIGLHG